MTTHYMEEADKLCDRIAIVDRGELLELDTPEALKQRAPGGTLVEITLSATRGRRGRGARARRRAARRAAGAAASRVQRSRRARDLAGDSGRPKTAARRSTNISLTEPSLETLFVSRTGRKLD